MLFPFSFMRTGGGFDPDAQAFFDRVTTAGGTLTTTEKNATNQLVLDMKSAGIWSAMKAVYPMVGASAAACAQNLKSSSFTGTFSSGWTFASTGVTPNGTSAYMNTNFNPVTQSQAQNSTYLSVYVRNNTGSGYDMGNSQDAGIAVQPTYIITRYSTNTAYVGIADQSYGTSITSMDSRGFWSGGTNGSSTQILYQNGTNIRTNGSTQSGFFSSNLYLGAANGGGAALFFTNHEYAFSTISDGLSPTQNADFYTAVQTFNQTLNRQVGAQIVSDADAQAYIDRVYTAGGTLTNTEANAVNQLVIDMKSAGIWTSMKAVYPMVGASAAACAQNLKSSSFTGTFSSGWTFSSTGATPNGTNAYMDTGLNISTTLSQDSTHLSYYSRTNTTDTSVRVDIGLLSGAVPFLYLSARLGAGYGPLCNINNTNINLLSQLANSLGFYIGSRVNSSQRKIYANNTLIDTWSKASETLINDVVVIGRNYGQTEYTDRQCAFASIGDGLTDTQAADFYTCVNTFQVSLSRNV